MYTQHSCLRYVLTFNELKPSKIHESNIPTNIYIHLQENYRVVPFSHVLCLFLSFEFILIQKYFSRGQEWSSKFHKYPFDRYSKDHRKEFPRSSCVKYFQPRPRQLSAKVAGAKRFAGARRGPINDATGARMHLNNWNERANGGGGDISSRGSIRALVAR